MLIRSLSEMIQSLKNMNRNMRNGIETLQTRAAADFSTDDVYSDGLAVDTEVAGSSGRA